MSGENFVYPRKDPAVDLRHSVSEAAEKLRRIEEFTEGIPPDVARFSRHLANYVGF